MKPRRLARVLAAALLTLSSVGSVHAQLTSDGTHGSANAYGTLDLADVTSTPTGDGGLQVSLGATASRAAGLNPLLWQEDFLYDASSVGTGEVHFGSASAALDLAASAKPQLVYATPVNAGNGPLANNGNAAADGIVSLQFTDVATVTSPALAAGTPVTVELHVVVASTDVEVGVGQDSFVGASFTGKLASLTAAVPELERLVLGSETAYAAFDTAVGHELRIEGTLRASGEIHAGYRPCCLFVTDVQAGTSVSSAGLWITTPPGVELVADSGTDYAQPVPEPVPAAAAAAALLALAARRSLPRSRRRAYHARRGELVVQRIVIASRGAARAFAASLLCVALGGAIARSAAADLLVEDGPFGPGTHTHDTATGLVWLDLTETTGYSHTQMVAELQPGGAFEGYRFATGDEIDALFVHAGIDLAAGASFTPQNHAPVVALTSLVGVLGTNGNCGSGCSFSYTQGYTGDPPPYGGAFAAANLSFFDNSAGLTMSYPQAPIGRAYTNGGSSDSASNSVGSFLVVPECDASWAGLGALLGLRALRYRARRGVPR